MIKQNPIYFYVDDQRLVRNSGDPIDLPPKPLLMLAYFISNQNRLLSVDDILQNVWPDTVVSKHSVKDYVATIRKALSDDVHQPRYIQTIRGGGYSYLGGITVVYNQKRRTVLGLGSDTTLFIGREAELQQLLATFDQPDCRALTITGPGGIGKTRLAAAAARTINTDHIVAFINLSQIRGDESVLSAITDTLGVRVSNETTTLQEVIERLAHRKLTIIVDNFDDRFHNQALLQSLLTGLPDTRFLITSRRPTNLYGEWVYTLKGMSVALETVESSDAERLFTQTARRADHSYNSHPDQAAMVTEICRALAGIPLAIELAAPMVSSLTLEDLHAAISSNSILLNHKQSVSGFADQSLADFMHRYWESLNCDEKVILSVLSLFFNGAPANAIVAISGCNKDAIDKLTDKAMCTKREDGRYALHDVMRDQAKASLELNRSSDRYKALYVQYYVRFARFADEHILTSDQFSVLKSLSQENLNLKQTLQWCEADGEFASHNQGLEIICKLSMCWFISNSWKEGIQSSIQLLNSAAGASAKHRAGAELTLAGLYALSENYDEAQDILLRCEQVFRDGPAKLKARTYIALGVLYRRQGRFKESIEYCKKSLSIYANSPDDGDALVALACLGQAYLDGAEYHLAIETFELSVDKCSSQGITSSLPHALVNLARANWATGNNQQANQQLDQCLIIARKVGIKIYIAQSHVVKGWIEIQANNTPQSLKSFAQAATLFEDLGHRAGLSECLHGMAVCAARENNLSHASQLLAAGMKLQEELGIENRSDCARYIRKAIQRVEENLSPSQINNYSLFGRSLTTKLLIANFYQSATVAVNEAGIEAIPS